MPTSNRSSGEGTAERRRQVRHSVQLRALVLLPDDQLLAGHTIDLSVGGACLSVPHQLLVDDECRLQLEFDAVGTHRTVLLISRVCYCVPQAQGFRVGVQFVQVSQDDEELINTLVS